MTQARGRARELAILAVANELLEEQGYDRLSVDAVAARARASKATIYSRWPDKPSLVAAALIVRSRDQPRLLWHAQNLREDLVAFVELCVRLAETESLTTFIGLLAAAEREPVLSEAVHQTALLPRRQDCRDIVQRAIGRGELSSPNVTEKIFDLVLGHILVRYLATRRPLDPGEQIEFVDDVLLPSLQASDVRSALPSK
ncbi:TetR/AcrR family transcriptional regulator C-terminal ligand-binding domain-containing protein [Nocardiopsis terrae]